MSTDDFNKLFGQYIREKRKQRGLTIEELALEVGVAFSTIQRIEQGSMPTNSTICKLVVILDLTDIHLKYLELYDSLDQDIND